ncbi:PTS transporter subunit EIIB, partial [Enterococcus faecalis]|uniref:PTS transporter subunit EIIB n=1 Tax=Enterococcus faecalis TaxID=1351 RepID=UPI003D6A948D
DNCTTRLRFTVNDTGKVVQAIFFATGVPGVDVFVDTIILVFVGSVVLFVAVVLLRFFSLHAPASPA